ncbi:S-adenosyl-L-methionine-dependent methyltransferase [Lipomyces oligophaga]|uniref:S-adenosyl-L-methionine-dependent methyltransferase n=1 Tax=Lipomyces oligophaga TaxID=45792 RepID=UPI0034CFE6E7
MASFSDSNYSSDLYSDFRPSYPLELYQKLLDFHQGPRSLVVDLGCGPGTATIPLSKYFDHAIGVDPSANMIKTATDNAHAKSVCNIQFIQSMGESVDELTEPGTVDMIVAPQSVHWFKHDQWFQNCAKSLRVGGTLAYFGYVDHQYKDCPRANEIIEEFSYGKSKLGPYWEPGRKFLRNLLREVNPPPNLYGNIQREQFIPGIDADDKCLISKTMTVAANRQYVYTWSSLHNYFKEHSEVSLDKGGSGDIVDQLFQQFHRELHWTDRTVVNVMWKHIIVLARKL